MVETVRLIESWLMPPGGILLLLLLALLLMGVMRRFSRLLLLVALLLLYLLSTPWMKLQLAQRLEVIPPLPQLPLIGEDQLAAIVVLGGGRYSAAAEFGRDVVGASTLERLRYGAHLHRESGFPLLVTGGTPLDESVPESQLMADSLWHDFGISGVWRESQSVNTWEHARLVPPILKQRGVTTLLLVTHASHMPRSLQVFRRAPESEGMTIIPAPTRFTTREAMDRGVGLWRPSAENLRRNVRFLHEWGGMIWYQIKYRD